MILSTQGQERIAQLADRVTAAQIARRAVVAEDGVDSNKLNFGLSEVVYEWAKGMVSHAAALQYHRRLSTLSL
jgi:hypothetical protein